MSEPSYHTTKFFTGNLLASEMKKNSNKYEENCLFRTIKTRTE